MTDIIGLRKAPYDLSKMSGRGVIEQDFQTQIKVLIGDLIGHGGYPALAQELGLTELELLSAELGREIQGNTARVIFAKFKDFHSVGMSKKEKKNAKKKTPDHLLFHNFFEQIEEGRFLARA